LLVVRGLSRSVTSRVGPSDESSGSPGVAERVLFADLDLELAPGRVVCVRGPSGSGKSLLLRAIAGLDPLGPLGSGTLHLNGQTPEALGMPTWRSRVAYVAQGAPPLPGTPAELDLGVRALASRRGRPSDDAGQIAGRLGLTPAQWTQPWTELSGGERQRAHLAVALAGRPDVLLLDEPTSALDAAAVAKVEAAVAGIAALWVTHDPGQIERVAADVIDLGSSK
jgi:ABC-type iron transport system FetAB ATPase subunit